jgi:hypothetical protein
MIDGTPSGLRDDMVRLLGRSRFLIVSSISSGTPPTPRDARKTARDLPDGTSALACDMLHDGQFTHGSSAGREGRATLGEREASCKPLAMSVVEGKPEDMRWR